MVSFGAAKVIVYSEDGVYYQLSLAGGVWSINVSSNIGSNRYPSACNLDGTRFVTIDDKDKTLQTYFDTVKTGEPYALDEVVKPRICSLDKTNRIIACLDEFTGKLRALQYNIVAPGTWSELGFIQLAPTGEVSVSYSQQNQVTVHDGFTGSTTRYTFDGTSQFTQTGNTATIGSAKDGYSTVMPTIITTGGEIVSYLKSGSMVVYDDRPKTIPDTFNRIATDGIDWGYGIKNTGTGADMDLTQLALYSLDTTFDNKYDIVNYFEDSSKYSMFDILKILEMMQQYFYVLPSADDPLPEYQVYFTQPDLFSSFGTDIVVPTETSDLLRSRLYNDNFKVNFESLNFKNEFNIDFVGDLIRYNIDY
jgi:hypothetical protein